MVGVVGSEVERRRWEKRERRREIAKEGLVVVKRDVEGGFVVCVIVVAFVAVVIVDVAAAGAYVVAVVAVVKIDVVAIGVAAAKVAGVLCTAIVVP